MLGLGKALSATAIAARGTGSTNGSTTKSELASKVIKGVQNVLFKPGAAPGPGPPGATGTGSDSGVAGFINAGTRNPPSDGCCNSATGQGSDSSGSDGNTGMADDIFGMMFDNKIKSILEVIVKYTWDLFIDIFLGSLKKRVKRVNEEPKVNKELCDKLFVLILEKIDSKPIKVNGVSKAR